jgi:Aflatoxin regulatory protein
MQFSSVGDMLMSYSWDPVDDNNNNHTTTTTTNNNKINDKSNNTENNKPNENNNSSGAVFNLDAFLCDSYGNLPGSSMSDFNSLDFGKWTDTDWLFYSSAPSSIVQFASLETPAKPDLHGDSTMGRTPGHPGCPPSDRGGSPPSAIKDHDCHREAHEVLGWSLFANPIRNGPNCSAAPPVTASTIGSGTDGVALDHLLLLNREASERLGCLLACSCAGSPYLMILYASLINAMLTRYQRAASGTLGASWGPLVSQGTSGSDNGESSAMLSVQQSAMAPAMIAIGAFSVDGLRVQSALKIQLLAGEVKRVARLIDQFASYHSDSQYLGKQSGSSSSVDGLHQSLSLWLRGEHSRITNMIRTRLRELL